MYINQDGQRHDGNRYLGATILSFPFMTSASIQCVIIITVIVIMTSSTQAQIQGTVAQCEKEGDPVFVPGISSDPCISCRCESREITCTQRKCSDNKGCHVILYDKPNNQCCEECQGCQIKDKKYESGSQWRDNRDPCRTFLCQAGVLTVSTQQCHVPCKNPQLLPGQCCPQCPGCSINGVQYKEGETFPSPKDSCASCTCQNGTTVCKKEICLVPNCPTAMQFTPLGSCCPKCRGKRKVYFPPGGSCLFQRDVIENGSSVVPDNCTSCTCLSGTLQCNRKTCPILDCASTDVIHESCCPVCQQRKRKCKFYGKKYTHGMVWKRDVCTHCLCDDGTVRCEAETCSNFVECPNNTRLKMKPGQCCPQCVDDGALCTVFGDPHYRTFDGRIYNFQGKCDYLLTQTCRAKDITVIVRNDARLTDQYAWTKSVRILIGGAKVYFLQKHRVKVNKKKVQLPYVHRRDKFSIVTTGRTVALKTATGIKVVWDGDSYLEVYVPPEFKNEMCGLCGNYNNDKSDDFLGPGGSLHIDPDEFGDSWLISKKRCNANTVPLGNTRQSPCAISRKRQEKALKACQAFYTPGFEHCRLQNDVISYHSSCVTDMCECADDSKCYCESLIAFTRACAQSGYDIQTHLPNECKAVGCPKGADWVDCASSCPKTCQKPALTCNTPCKPGCQCPAGKLLHKNKCVRPSRCQSDNKPAFKRHNKNEMNPGKRKIGGFNPLDYLIE